MDYCNRLKKRVKETQARVSHIFSPRSSGEKLIYALPTVPVPTSSMDTERPVAPSAFSERVIVERDTKMRGGAEGAGVGA